MQPQRLARRHRPHEPTLLLARPLPPRLSLMPRRPLRPARRLRHPTRKTAIHAYRVPYRRLHHRGPPTARLRRRPAWPGMPLRPTTTWRVALPGSSASSIQAHVRGTLSCLGHRRTRPHRAWRWASARVRHRRRRPSAQRWIPPAAYIMAVPSFCSSSIGSRSIYRVKSMRVRWRLRSSMSRLCASARAEGEPCCRTNSSATSLGRVPRA